MKCKSKFNHFDIVYLNNDIEQIPYRVIEFRVLPKDLIQVFIFSPTGEELSVYEEQLSSECDLNLRAIGIIPDNKE